MTQYGFFFDQSRCNNCHACSVACRDWNQIEAGPVKWLRILQEERGVFPDTSIDLVFATCYHCKEPLCVDACKPGALFKEEKYGAVLVDEDLCSGCRDCWTACPYGATQFEDDAPGTLMSKCTMCYDRLERGEVPVCVAGCPARALDFGPVEELREKYGELDALVGMPNGGATHPSVVFKPADEKQRLVPYESQEALKLLRRRGNGLPDVFDRIEDVTEVYDGLVGYGALKMKSATVAENLALSKNEQG